MVCTSCEQSVTDICTKRNGQTYSCSTLLRKGNVRSSSVTPLLRSSLLVSSVCSFRAMSSALRSSSLLMQIVFRNILLIMSSRITTISCPRYCIRHGLVAKIALGICEVICFDIEPGKADRGSVVPSHGSVGPGTKIKCDSEATRGN